jgi:pyruvate/2-oxoglutarate dehydrogenase complex dihydrolipoamide acyltransferase (E2) component
VESYLRGKRNAGMKNLGFLHIVIAAIVRTLSQKPGLNRFVAGQRIYARNEILISLAVKKDLKEESPETTVKIKFEPADTIYDVMEKVNKVIEENKKEEVNNDTDKTAKIISLCPGFLIKFIVWFMAKLDYHRIMPKIINRVSPFHTSIFITDLGSVGIQSAYHHIYEFGTTSIFVAFGTKKKERVIDADNNVVEKRTINLRVVADERIVDGHYYARAFRLFNRYMLNPERLEVPPEKVVEDLA